MNKDQFDLMDLTVGFTTGKINSKENFRHLFLEGDCNLIDIICKMDIGQGIESLTSSCLNENLHKLFNEIKFNHKVTEYKRIFEKDLKKRNWFLKFKNSQVHYPIPQKCQYQVHPSHIREGMRRIYYKLIPSKFIGNRNQTKIFKALYNFLNTSSTEPFSLLNLMKSLNVESISWVQEINDPNKKIIFMGKFVKWLFKLFIAIIEKVFYMRHIQGEKVFIFIGDWEVLKNDQLKSFCQRSALQLVGPVDKSVETNNRLFFMPKLGNLRPITIFNFNDNEIQMLKKIKTLLHYLYEKNCQKPDTPYKQKLIEIFQDFNRDKNRIFVVSADILDAYGSILQGKLFDIVRKMFTTLPDTVNFTYTFVRNVKRYQIIPHDPNRLSYAPQKIEIVDKQLLLQVLKNHIFQTRVIFKNKIYNINRGIAQGSIISSILCAIYYAQMKEKYFAEFKTQGDLFNYVDDFLYITNQLDSAQKFLEKVVMGITEYNCTFNKSKLKHNLTLENSQIIYLGWKFNLQPLKIKPIYNSTRHSIHFNSLNIGSHELKLKNLSSLKLDKLVFTKKVHNDDKIFEMTELVCQRQAERCFALSSCLYATRREIVDIKSITRVNGMLINKIQRLTEWDDCETRKNRKILKLIILKAFIHVFARRHDIFFNLIVDFQRIMKNCNKKEF